MPSLPTRPIPQTLIGLVLWLWWAAGAFAYSNPHPAYESATVCNLYRTTDGQRNYSYNSEQRLATTSATPTTANPNPAKTNYLYNALGQRVFKTDPIFGTPTADNQKLGWAYIYDETGTLLGEYGMGGAASSGSTEHIYLPTAAGPLPVATIINGQHYAVHTDHLNTPRRLTAANNQAVWQWAYSAFGQEQATTAAKRFTNTNTVPATGATTTQPVAYHQRYPGQSYDVESGLHYNYFRSYDPQTGRYTQADPIGLEGGWNRYVYAENNPLEYVDLFGLAPPRRYIYQRVGIHHQLPNAVARDMGWSPAAVREFDVSGFNPPLHGKTHYREGDITHRQYNSDVKKFCEDWVQINKIDPAKATADDAKRLMYDLRYNAPSTIMDFNRSLWMRGMLSNTYWLRPTE